MKKILGLDLGVGSIGWCLIEKMDDGTSTIKKLGSRIVPLSSKESDSFKQGSAISKNQERTKKRTARKTYDRYQLRRKELTEKLKELNCYPNEELFLLNPLELWSIRAKAACEKVTLQELGRVLLHINQKRGYKHSRQNSDDSKETVFVSEVNSRFDLLKQKRQTVGQYFAEKMKESTVSNEKNDKKHYTFRIKDQVLPRKAYEDEFFKIMDTQRSFYPELLSKTLVDELHGAIFYQRPLRSCKHLVSICEIEKQNIVTPDGREITIGPKVAPKSSPIAQICKIWESVNNLKISNRKNDILYISPEKKAQLVEYMQTNATLKVDKLYEILEIEKKDGWWAGKAVGKGLQGNNTRIKLQDALASLPEEKQKELLSFNITIEEIVDKETGEVVNVIEKNIVKEPLYKLWHLVYSIKDSEELKAALIKFGIKDETALENLCKIDFVKDGYANKSVKAIRRTLPYLIQGYVYSQACALAGFRHSDYLTKEENISRTLKNFIPQIKKNELRQPIVEKVLNQMINIVNSLMNIEGGNFDEIRIELARELKQSREERNEAWSLINKNEKRNKEIADIISKEYNLVPTRNRIMKYKMWEETGHVCIYCGQTVPLKEFLDGVDYEKEHIIPKSLLFDNSFSNQACACRKCNQEKNNRTAYDFIQETRSPIELDNYVDRINNMFAKKQIGKTKRDHLLASYKGYQSRKSMGKETDADKQLWESFIERQLRQSQYIARKAVELLQSVCHNVTTTSGSVTDFVRHAWGYDDVLHDLNFNRFRDAGKTEIVTIISNGVETKKERIKDWTKRIDNRHHAIDALTIALTTPSIIQRLNRLNAERELMEEEVKESGFIFNERKSRLEKWLTIQKHPSVEEVKQKVSGILISIKSGRKVCTRGKRYEYKNGKRILRQEGLLIPRTALHDEYVYGAIKQYVEKGGKKQLETFYTKKYNLAIGSQGCLFNGKEEYKVKIQKDEKTGLDITKITDNIKDTLEKVVDHKIHDLILARLNQGFAEGQDYRDDVKKALNNLKDLGKNPIYFDEKKTMPIRTVRKIVPSSTMVPIRFNDKGEPIAFVEPGSNHHIALYRMPDGSISEQTVTMWQAVERMRYGIPAIIKNPEDVWQNIFNQEDLPDTLLKSMPNVKSEFIESMQIDDMFILGMDENEANNAIENMDLSAISDYLYVVQNLSHENYRFRRHVESQFDTKDMNKIDKRFYNVQSISALFKLNPIKIKINLLGSIV